MLSPSPLHPHLPSSPPLPATLSPYPLHPHLISSPFLPPIVSILPSPPLPPILSTPSPTLSVSPPLPPTPSVSYPLHLPRILSTSLVSSPPPSYPLQEEKQQLEEKDAFKSTR